MSKVFDLHFHFLVKHILSKGIPLNEIVHAKGITKLLDQVMGGPLSSQSSPEQVKNSPLFLGVIAILSIEHAYANRMLQVGGLDLSKGVPIDAALINDIREGNITYYDEFKKHVEFYIDNKQKLSTEYNIEYLNRKDWAGKTVKEISEDISNSNKRLMTFSIEGGHSLSNVPIHKGILSKNPEVQLKELQDNSMLDFISLNLCHLSYIPEQHLGGFAQGANKLSQKAFHSEDFSPKHDIGITEAGKKVIKQALLHPSKPILLDVKHMSVYTRFHYYRFRENLILENPGVERLPVISSHSGFTFTSIADFISGKKFRSSSGVEDGLPISVVEPENRKIGKTNDLINSGLFCNPWTINLFDEEIVEIMQSKGMIGIILDQRVLGASNPAVDSLRDKYYEEEYIAYPEWQKLFRDGQLPGSEALDGVFSIVTPSRPERHIMLFCLHIIYAVQLGNANLSWVEGTSPWDCICLGSDYDGLINPINGFETVEKLHNLKHQLEKYLPQADKLLKTGTGEKALRYTIEGKVDKVFLDEAIDTFLYKNGVSFIARYLNNWME